VVLLKAGDDMHISSKNHVEYDDDHPDTKLSREPSNPYGSISESGKTGFTKPDKISPVGGRVPGTVGISIRFYSSRFFSRLLLTGSQRNSERALPVAEEPLLSDSMSSPNISFGNVPLFDVCETPRALQPWSRPDLTSGRLYEYNEPIGYNLVNNVPYVEVGWRRSWE
jgi:hypothetical protein